MSTSRKVVVVGGGNVAPPDESTPLLLPPPARQRQQGTSSPPSLTTEEYAAGRMFLGSFRRRSANAVVVAGGIGGRGMGGGRRRSSASSAAVIAAAAFDDEDEVGMMKRKDEEGDEEGEVTPLLPSTTTIGIYNDLLPPPPTTTTTTTTQQQQLLLFPIVHPAEGLAPLVFPKRYGLLPYDDRSFVPYREPSLIKSLPPKAPYRRTARHRSFYLWWTNEFRHWWKSSRLLVRLSGLYVYSYDPPSMVQSILVLDPNKYKTMRKLLKYSKRLGQGGPVRDFLNFVQPFTRTMRILVGSWRWFEASPCRRWEVGIEEFMAFVGNRVSRLVARTGTDMLAYRIVYPIQRILFRYDILDYPAMFHPVALCVCVGIVRAVTPYLASFKGSWAGRTVTRQYFRSSRNRWLPTLRISELNLTSDDCREMDEVDQGADLCVIARIVAKALGTVQTNVSIRQHEALSSEGFHQVGAGRGGYAVYQRHHESAESDAVLLHVAPYGPSIVDVMPYYLVLESESSCDCRQRKWSNSLTATLDASTGIVVPVVGKVRRGPDVLEGYCYQGAFFSTHHFAEMKEMYDKQLLAYEAGCKKLPRAARLHREIGVPRDLPALKKFLEAGKRNRKRKRNKREFNELQKVVTNVAKDILGMIKRDEKGRGSGGRRHAPKGVILYFEGLDCSGKSSTGGLVQAALEQGGYEVGMRQYNRPPTAEQRKMNWMDRFDVPGSLGVVQFAPSGTDDDKREDDERIALVWDRGPAGDFVYGGLNDLPAAEKRSRYEEFIAFDERCRENDILFLKLLFVTNRDSIAKTLGKRLAQKKMAKDLTTWLRACSSRGGEEDVLFEGLEAISAHIDPTDFVAFNNYERNLQIFSNFALNTDSEQNPWVVVNTGDRYAARKSLMRAFRSHLHYFESRGKGCSPCCGSSSPASAYTRGMDVNEMMQGNFTMSRKQVLLASISLGILLLLAYIYADNTDWDDTWFHAPTRYNISSLLEEGTDDYVTVDRKGKTKKNAEDDSAKASKTAKIAKSDKDDKDYPDKAQIDAAPEGDESPKASKVATDDKEAVKNMDRSPKDSKMAKV